MRFSCGFHTQEGIYQLEWTCYIHSLYLQAWAQKGKHYGNSCMGNLQNTAGRMWIYGGWKEVLLPAVNTFCICWVWKPQIRIQQSSAGNSCEGFWREKHFWTVGTHFSAAMMKKKVFHNAWNTFLRDVGHNNRLIVFNLERNRKSCKGQVIYMGIVMLVAGTDIGSQHRTQCLSLCFRNL